ncbi:hypothetical protein GGR56DRAFT_667078 [Xylariaceae sp. FL0804]|nr:hypothetical protein GGR56DRAFT_667078 [Xylariaceae sp. FL0804]
MDTGPPEPKRPRLSTGSSWSQNHGVLPHPAVAHLPPASGPHHPMPSAYQPSPVNYSRPPEPPLSAGHHHPHPHAHDDRRFHHDHESYPPIQDPSRQLPHSPSHPQYPPYAPREPIVKRDPAEDTSLPQLRRPNSTSNVTDGLPPPSHGHPPPSLQQSDDPRRHMSFDSGPTMPHSPAIYRPQHPGYPQPPTPITQQAPYESPHVYGHPNSMYSVEIQAPASAKRKAQRASQACESCRQLKAKCDEMRPCKNCREKSVECIYRDPPAKQPDKVTADILDLLQAMKDEMASMKGALNQRLLNVESALQQRPLARADLKVESVENDDPEDLSQSPMLADKADAGDPSSPAGTFVEPSLTIVEAQETLKHANMEDIEDQPGGPVMPGSSKIPQNHTNMAQLLLKWPSVQAIAQPHLLNEKILHVDEFPIRQEQQRGMLRVFGKGEGFDQDPKLADKGTPLDSSLTDIEDWSDTSSPVPTGDVWGQIGGFATPPTVSSRGGPISSDGIPDWSREKVWKYVQSFKDNILNMHPIIIPRELDAMVKVFLTALPKPKEYQPAAKVSSIVKFVHQPPGTPSMPEIGVKRKRSPAGNDDFPGSSFSVPGRPFRSVQNALVLLVLALGKDQDAPPYNSPSGSPPGFFPPSQSSGLPSPKESDRGAPRGSQSHRRNVDVIPGLDQIGGYNLKHVYLSRVLESWSYISLASRTLQVILRPSLGRLTDQPSLRPDSRRDNQLAFAFWTCLQLESDLIAELPVPHSGILMYESQMPYPNLQFAVEHGFEAHVVLGYLAQLYLRKQLNQLQYLLYNPETKETEKSVEDGILRIQQSLKNSRDTWVPTYYRWNDQEGLATDLLSARLRAKYWGSQVILYRPFLKVILNKEIPSFPLYSGQPDPDFLARLNAEIGGSNASLGVDVRTVHYARLGMEALVESTRAFHGLPPNQRLIITNHFGTAHAQWGNLLTLSACYRDPILGRFIDRELLSQLFLGTIGFFHMIAYPTSALTNDMNILVGIGKDLGLLRDDYTYRAKSSSFSSTGGPPLPFMQSTGDEHAMHGASTPTMVRNTPLPPPAPPPPPPPHHPMAMGHSGPYH